MKINLTVRSLQIPFRQSFKHASAERKTTQTIWVEAISTSGVCGFGEGCPREYVTGESVTGAMAFISRVTPQLTGISDLAGLAGWVEENRELIDANPAAWCAVELAIIDLLARESNQPAESFLSLPPIQGPFRYTAVLGAEAPPVFRSQLEKYLAMGFRDFKVKLSGGPEDFERMALLRSASPSVDRLRMDGNNLWQSSDDAIAHLERLDVPMFAIEEPLAAGDYEEAGRIAKETGLKIILDESLLRLSQLEQLPGDPGNWIMNLRISKMGGLLRSLEMAERAASMRIPMIIGCQVGETSLLTRAALPVAQAFMKENLLAQEGAFGTLLLSQDVVAPPLMFGERGLLEIGASGFSKAAGFGLEPRGLA